MSRFTTYIRIIRITDGCRAFTFVVYLSRYTPTFCGNKRDEQTIIALLRQYKRERGILEENAQGTEQTV